MLGLSTMLKILLKRAELIFSHPLFDRQRPKSPRVFESHQSHSYYKSSNTSKFTIPALEVLTLVIDILKLKSDTREPILRTFAMHAAVSNESDQWYYNQTHLNTSSLLPWSCTHLLPYLSEYVCYNRQYGPIHSIFFKFWLLLGWHQRGLELVMINLGPSFS